jgi:hypothetical protein
VLQLPHEQRDRRRRLLELTGVYVLGQRLDEKSAVRAGDGDEGLRGDVETALQRHPRLGVQTRNRTLLARALLIFQGILFLGHALVRAVGVCSRE